MTRVGRWLAAAKTAAGSSKKTATPKEAACSLRRQGSHQIDQYLAGQDKVFNYFVGQVMAANLHDVAQSWVMQPDGRFTRAEVEDGGFAFNCHRFFMENPSLSGRGRAGAEDVPELLHSHD